MIALTVDFKDLGSRSSGGYKKLQAVCKKFDTRCTVFVTPKDLDESADFIKELSKSHCIGITTSAYFTDGWDTVKSRIREASIRYFKVIGKQPSWYRGEGGHRHPAALLASTRLGMRVVFWSTLCLVQEGSSSDMASLIKDDFLVHRGGNVVAFRGSGGEEDVSGEVSRVIEGLASGGIKLDTLDPVIKDDQHLVLDC